MGSGDSKRARLSETIQGIPLHDHLCAIYESPQQATELSTIFVQAGLERGEYCAYLAADDGKAASQAMRAIGIEPEKAREKGSLILLSGQQMASKLGRFDSDKLIAFWKESLKAAKAAGRRTLRVVDDMKWMLNMGATPEQLLRYEADLNPFLRNHPMLAICLYDRRQFPAEMLLSVVRTHPKVVCGWSVCKNPYYVPPEELLQPPDSERELRRWLGHIESHQRMEDSLHRLSKRLLTLQDEERRNIARHLHETVAQTLAALKMNLAKANRSELVHAENLRALLDESMQLVDESTQEIRTVSYLLHPPLLDEAGLLPALRWYVAGFAERSGIKVKLDVLRELGRLPKDVETAAFRIVQESLTNVHRHSKSATAEVRILGQGNTLRVDVEDAGVGMAASTGTEPGHEAGFGVGLAAIRQRVTQLGGWLQIDTSSRGTTVSVSLPVPTTNLCQNRAS
jgi:signal transduction histidine kinase